MGSNLSVTYIQPHYHLRYPSSPPLCPCWELRVKQTWGVSWSLLDLPTVSSEVRTRVFSQSPLIMLFWHLFPSNIQWSYWKWLPSPHHQYITVVREASWGIWLRKEAQLQNRATRVLRDACVLPEVSLRRRMWHSKHFLGGPVLADLIDIIKCQKQQHCVVCTLSTATTGLYGVARQHQEQITLVEGCVEGLTT